MEIKVNPDNNVVRSIRNKIKENEGYCPCSIVRSDDTKCMCKEFKEQKTEGYCHCGLYFKAEA